MRNGLLYRRSFLLATMITAAASAQPLPTGETVMDHYVEVTGGKAAYQKHTSQVIAGVISFPAQGITGQLTRYAMAPDKEYSIVELASIGKIETGFSNDIAWEKNAITGPRLKSGEEKEQTRREAHFNAASTWRDIYAKVETIGTEATAGEDCYKVLLTPKQGRAETQYYSIKTGLLLKTTTVAVSPMGDVNVEATFSNYKNFDGVLFPLRSVQKAGAQQLELTISNISFNETIPPEYFEPPAEIRALMLRNGGKK